MTGPVPIRRVLPVLGWLAVGLLLPSVLGLRTLQIGQLDYVLAVVMLACGLNIVWGYAGQLFLGPGALFAVGGYAAGVLAEHHTTLQSLPAMVATAVVVAVALALVTAIPSLRVGGFYLGLVTLFLAFAAPILASRLGFLGSYRGVSLVSIDSFHQRPSGLALYRSGVVLLGLLVGFSWLVTHSRLGRRFTALRSGDDLAQSVGVPLYWTKVVAFVLGAVPCGAGGAFYVYSQQIVSPASVSPTLSLYVFGAVVIGGSGTTLGPILGATLVMAANQFLGGFTKYEGIVFGVIVVATAAGLPRGLVGLGAGARARWGRLRAGRARAPSGPAPEHRRAGAWPQPAIAGPRSGTDPGPHRGHRISAAPDGARLVVSSVSRSFGGIRAVNGVDLVVEPGQVHALVGPNGSGKTTLLNLICGFYRLDGGTIWLGGRRLDGRRVSDVTRMGVARTFQTPKLALGDTALSNVVMGADRCSPGWLLGSVVRSGQGRRADRDAVTRAEQALAEVGLGDVGALPAAELTHSTQRLLEFGRAVALQPRLVLLDEPAAGLSVPEAAVLKATVRAMAATGLGVLLVEHNLPVVFDVADRVTVLNEGEVVASGSPSEVSADPEVVRVYLGRSRLEDLPGRVAPQG